MEQKDIVLEALKKYREELTPEDLEKFQKKLEFNENRINRYIEKIHNMSVDERSIFINKCINKYTSDEYIEKEYKHGWEPRCPLYDILIQYAVRYGIPAMYKQEDNDYFPEEQYDIDGKFVITAIHGQGTIIYVKRVPEDEIIPHILEEYPLTIFNNKDEKICETSSESTFLDILIQLKYKKMTGYYVIHKGRRFEINNYKVKDRNFEFGRIYGNLLRELTLEYSNEY